MNRKSFLALVLFLASLATFTPSHADPGTIVGIYPPTANASSGTVTIAVNVYDVVNLQAVEFTLRYDTTKLDALSINFTSRTIPGSCECGFFLNQTIDDPSGTITVSYTLLGQQFSGDGTLAFITFRPTALGISTVNLQDVTLVNNDFNPITHTLSDGQVFAAASGGGGGSHVILV